MNAEFYRGHAVDALEELSLIISIHAVLVVSYPESEAREHWCGEMRGFCKTLRRLNKGKKGRNNFTIEMLIDEFSSHMTESDEQETIMTHIQEKGLDIGKIEWEQAKALIVNFSREVMEGK